VSRRRSGGRRGGQHAVLRRGVVERVAWRLIQHVARAPLDTLPLQLELDDEQSAHTQRGGGRHGSGPRRAEYAAAHQDALRPERGRDGAGEKGAADSPFPEEDVDAGRENGDDPVPSSPVPAPASVTKSKSGGGKSKEKKKGCRCSDPFPALAQDGATGGERQQQERADERERERQRNVTVSSRPPAQGRSDLERQSMHTARSRDAGRTQSGGVRKSFLSFYRRTLASWPFPTCLFIGFFFFLRDLTRTYLGFACTTYLRYPAIHYMCVLFAPPSTIFSSVLLWPDVVDVCVAVWQELQRGRKCRHNL
jgi:hypothetical protein